MKLAVNLAVSFAMLALCVWLVWPDAQGREHVAHAMRGIHVATFWPYLAGYLGLLAVTHFARAWRWNSLLAPLGVTIPGARLLAISSVGFMAILALPARLGEFVRPALIRRKGHISASAALGTVAVERIVDGLMVSLFVFGACFALRGPDAPSWMMPTAYAALGIFGVATVFLLFALRRPEETVRLALTLSLLDRLVPRVARALEAKLLEMIRGFAVLRDPRNLTAFLLWSAGYWLANGLSLWVLARGMNLPLSLIGSYATMALVAVGITLPNSPGLVGQFQYFTLLGVSLYLGKGVLDVGTALHGAALAFAIVHHLLQVIWYVGMGGLAIATPYVSLAEVWQARKLDPDGAPGHDRAA
jgi:glycosyltransferase 2 family protein